MSTWKQATERAGQRVPERSRCAPSFAPCDQAKRCAMTADTRRGTVIDGSVLKRDGGCPLFVDARHPVAGSVQ